MQPTCTRPPASSGVLGEARAAGPMARWQGAGQAGWLEAKHASRPQLLQAEVRGRTLPQPSRPPCNKAHAQIPTWASHMRSPGVSRVHPPWWHYLQTALALGPLLLLLPPPSQQSQPSTLPPLCRVGQNPGLPSLRRAGQQASGGGWPLLLPPRLLLRMLHNGRCGPNGWEELGTLPQAWTLPGWQRQGLQQQQGKALPQPWCWPPPLPQTLPLMDLPWPFHQSRVQHAAQHSNQLSCRLA
ncbi:hypothetical protein V8C86DRAFT_2626668, partial [Haematococcus lacustris]